MTNQYFTVKSSPFDNETWNQLGKFIEWNKVIQTPTEVENYRLASLLDKKTIQILNTPVSSNSLAGSWKCPGGVTHPNGKIYVGPDRTSFVIEFDPSTNTASYVGQDLGTATAKYYGGCLAHNSIVYFIGDRLNSWLTYNPATNTSTTTNTVTTGTAKWAGIVQAPNGFLYTVPRSASVIIKIDPITNTGVEFGSLVGSNKYRGGVVGADGKVYFIPWFANQVCVLNPVDDSISFISTNLSQYGSDKWQGGSLAPNGKIYCMPGGNMPLINGMRPVLVINTLNQTVSIILSLYNVANCVTGVDGNIYGHTLTANPGLFFKLNTTTDTFEWTQLSTLYTYSHLGAAVGLDGAVYLTPYVDGKFIKITNNVTADPDRILSRYNNIA
jgi:hypothetical protein